MRLIRIISVLAASAMATAAPAEVSTKDGADKKDRKICRTFAETGSLVKRVRVCKPASQWAAESAMLKQSSGVTSCSIQPCNVPGK